MDLGKALLYLFPEAKPGVDYVLQDDSDGKGPYIKEWNLPDPIPDKPTLVDAEKQYDLQIKANTYKKKRKKEYPSIGDQLDVLWSVLDSAGIVAADPTKPKDTPEGMLAFIKSIKAKYPKNG